MTPSVKRIFRDHQQAVADNMASMLQATPATATIPPDPVLVLRAKLILEEALETIAGLGVSVSVGYRGLSEQDHSFVPVCKGAMLEFERDMPPNLFEVADGLADLEYVTLGTWVAFGLNSWQFFEEVHRSNMTKCWTDEEIARLQFEKGSEAVQIHPSPFPSEARKWVVLDASGKYMKSPSYSPANIRAVLAAQLAS